MGVVIDILLDKILMNKARAFNPFLCARTDKVKALIAEVQTQLEGYEFFHQTRKRARRPADQATVRRQGFWNQWRLKLRECLAHLVGFIMRRAVCDASVAFQVSFV